MSYKIKNRGLEVKTKDGKNIMGSDFTVKICEHDAKNRSFVAIGSTENPDRSKDIIVAEGWELKNYKKAPRGMWAHDYYSVPIFKSTETKIDKEKKQLIFKPEFDGYDFANLVYNQYLNGFMSDFSVGFIAKEMEYINPDRPWSDGIKFLKQELLEISSVPIPDNPEAQKLGLAGNDITNLIKMGYVPEFNFDEIKGLYWNPISKNLDGYYQPKMIAVANGIKAVQATPIFQENANPEVVGYFFDSVVMDEIKVKDWLNNNVKVVPKVKYFCLSLNEEAEDKKIELEIQESEVEKEDKSVDDETIEIEDEVENKGKDEETDDDKKKCADCEKPMKECSCTCAGCNKPKKECSCNNEKPKSLTINLINEKGEIVNSKTFEGENVDKVLQIFDNGTFDNVDLIVDLKGRINILETSVEELKKNLADKIDKGSNSNSDEDSYELDLSEFPPVSSSDKDSEEFEIESLEDISNLSLDSGEVVDTLSNTFSKILNSVIKDGKVNLD